MRGGSFLDPQRRFSVDIIYPSNTNTLSTHIFENQLLLDNGDNALEDHLL